MGFCNSGELLENNIPILAAARDEAVFFWDNEQRSGVGFLEESILREKCVELFWVTFSGEWPEACTRASCHDDDVVVRHSVMCESKACKTSMPSLVRRGKKGAVFAYS